MKKLKYASIISFLFLCSCSVINPILTEEEKEKFVLKGDKVLYEDGVAVMHELYYDGSAW